MVATARTTFTLDDELAAQAHQLEINISAAARAGVLEAVRVAQAEADRSAYRQRPEESDPFWEQAESWASGVDE